MRNREKGGGGREVNVVKEISIKSWIYSHFICMHLCVREREREREREKEKEGEREEGGDSV